MMALSLVGLWCPKGAMGNQPLQSKWPSAPAHDPAPVTIQSGSRVAGSTAPGTFLLLFLQSNHHGLLFPHTRLHGIG